MPSGLALLSAADLGHLVAVTALALTVLVASFSVCFLGGALARFVIAERAGDASGEHEALLCALKAVFADRFGGGALRGGAVRADRTDQVALTHHAV